MSPAHRVNTAPDHRSGAITPTRCPCGGVAYDTCCGRLHRRETDGVTATQVMRARYSAFALHDREFLLRSWHPSTRPRTITLDPTLHWIRLEILDAASGDLLDTEGAVEFEAHHRNTTGRAVLHERSVFVRHEQRWVYVGPVAANIT